MRAITLLPLCLLLFACQTKGPLDENSPYHILPSGSRLILKRELTIPAHSAGVWLQGGRVMSIKDINQYHPHCRLEVNDVRETTQTVTADEIVVRRARQEETNTVARTGLMKAQMRIGGDVRVNVFRTTLDLHSERQPQVRWLTCQQWSEAALGQHVTIREMRVTLGEIFTLQLPSNASDGNR
jgi:hypothetical protein